LNVPTVEAEGHPIIPLHWSPHEEDRLVRVGASLKEGQMKLVTLLVHHVVDLKNARLFV
jgi:hypothetical protein